MADDTPRPPLRPLRDVWLKPRRVFRALGAKPIALTDYLLAGAQGIVSVLVLSRGQSLGAKMSVVQVLGEAGLIGPIAGILGVFVLAAIYTRLGRRMGGQATRPQIVHVFAYGGVPMLASLILWLLVADLAGASSFMETPSSALPLFLRILLKLQFVVHGLLVLWSSLLQVMGLSEMQSMSVRRAFGMWLLGQLLTWLAAIVFLIGIGALGLLSGIETS
jgi:hypothetical protein